MKILYLSSGTNPDYMCDGLFAGLRSLLGDDVIDYRRLWFMYADSFGEGKYNLSDLYGKGMTLYGILPSDANVDRTDIVEKLKKHYFDLVFYGSIQRNQAYFGGVVEVYKPSEIVMIDGEDYPGALLLQKYGYYFKRELHSAIDGFYSIEFGVPKEKILKEPPKKTVFMAPYDPLFNKEYMFNTEKEYYQSYADSYFGATMKKAGWCCLRHAELMMNWCIPYFRVLDQCPETIMPGLPRKELMLVKSLIEYSDGCDAGFRTAIYLYDRIIEKVMKALHDHMTTEAIAKKVLDTVLADK